MKLSHQKLKMMYLAKILMEKTDEEHTIIMAGWPFSTRYCGRTPSFLTIFFVK